MSYEKVRSIRVDLKQNKLFINCASNNVRPLTYSTEEYPYFSKILQEKGLNEVEIALLKSYEEGSFQEGSNKYVKALQVLRYVFGEEYKKFNWRNHFGNLGTEEREEHEKLRKSEDFKDLLLKCLNYKFSKEKYVITKKHYDGTTIYAKVCPTKIRWEYSKEKASKFYFKEQAEDHIYTSLKNICLVEALE